MYLLCCCNLHVYMYMYSVHYTFIHAGFHTEHRYYIPYIIVLYRGGGGGGAGNPSQDFEKTRHVHYIMAGGLSTNLVVN